jgi:hypothetical protein
MVVAIVVIFLTGMVSSAIESRNNRMTAEGHSVKTFLTY